MRILSLYCGAGGIDEGLKQAGFKTTTAIDIDADSCKSLKINHPDTEVINGSVIDHASTFSNYDVVVGGPPCPEFSNANPKRTYDLSQVKIFWNIIDKIKPTLYLMENVPNIIRVFKKEPNYILDSSDHGVPQTRKRRFYTNIKKPGSNPKIGLDSLFDYDGFVSNSGFSNCNQHCISRPINEPCKTLQVAASLRITDKPVYSKKYPKYPQDYAITHIFTNEELKLIQSFPNNYKFYGNKQSVKRQICNAVPPKVIKSIFDMVKTN